MLSRRLRDMRIAIPIHSFEPGGVERVALRLAEHWQEAGHEPIVVLGRHRGPCADTAPGLDYRTMREPVPTDRWETIWMIWSFFQFLLSEKVDVIFCPGNTYTVVCVAMKILLGERCPAVLVKISNDLERRDLPKPVRPLYRWWLRVQGATLDGFVAIADPMRAEIETVMELPASRVSVIPDPALSQAELRSFAGTERSARQAPGCRFLTVGRLAQQKNQMLLLDAFANHARPEDTLVIAGDGPERERLLARARAPDLCSRVSFAGHVGDVRPLYANSDVFVLSSHYEGAPAVIVEALAAGLPIAATNCCVSMEWLVGNGRFGTVVPCGDAAELGRALTLVRDHQPDRKAMREMVGQFTLECSATLYLRTLADLITRARMDRQAKLLSSTPASRWTEF